MQDLSRDEVLFLIEFSEHLKYLKKNNISHEYLKGKNIALLFEKTSTRTRSAFTVASNDLGAFPEFMGKDDTQLGKKESVRDTALVLGSMFDGIEFRGFKQEHVEELAKYAGVPIWNGLTDNSHPTQMLADFMTMKEEFGSLKGLKLVYFGAGKNNVCNSLMITSAILGVNFTVATPAEITSEDSVVKKAMEFAKESGAEINIENDPVEAVKGADVIYTNVWAAMGEESQFAERVKLLKPYQVNSELVKNIGKDNYIVLHCLPANHNRETGYGEEIYKKFGLEAMEITDDIFYGSHARMFEQAENRMHSIKAIMAATLGSLFIPEIPHYE